ncbi:MAG: hypothetical protein CVU32_01820 [Betaproteobacteria bacterium HGW-Betaproteobacteria-5]|jgi:hypothetical protein|nr:MAG: hypothetical protein CVU32_01820 [Betaproteobacteria bacterium HGW-Betaproteobacteria-5]PKO40150.1 MAG: hypothetical protein CVU33_03030 [Betaproteobacteria bacterium HGW-Betaproteobacteria-6]PKO93189.1 MAG: hypothetical protein CVU16_05795 [Betaproteobacteria bacterium HGW-Betaproteobacteria-10]
MAADLKKIRVQIDGLKAEIAKVNSALPPVDEQVALLRGYLVSLTEPYQRFMSLAAGVVSRGVTINELINNIPPSRLPIHALGIGLAAHNVDNVIEQVLERAKAEDNGALRLSTDDREDRLAELRSELYMAELAEEAALDGAERRPGANSACVLGIPLAAALEIDERNQNNYLLSGKW